MPSALAAISKAITAAYLSSSEGNAISTRTANQIIQQHFNPGVAGTPSGPLFGVQISQPPGSDFNTVAAATPAPPMRAPHSSPLALVSWEAGQFIKMDVAGSIGVMLIVTYS